MKNSVLFIFSACLFVILLVSTPLTIWENLSIAMFIYFFLEFLNNLGKRVVIFDITVLLAVFTCLVMPVIFYHNFDRDNRLAHLWKKYMFVSSDDYFSFALPAIALMTLGFRVPLGKGQVEKNPYVYMQRVKEELKNRPRIGMILIMVGIVSGFFTNLVPEAVKQFFYFLDHLIYVGVFYVLYSPVKNRKLVYLVVAIMVGESIAIGMFGELIFMLALSLCLILLGTKTSFWKKLSLALGGVYLILLLQSVKMDYRKQAWLGSGADPVYFASLIGDRLSNPTNMFDEGSSFLLAVRMNQGWLIGTTMYYVPDKYPYAYGETIWQSVAASFAPRFLWPDKPEAGGKANLKRFWGFNLNGYSMNIGPIGEAYGNFGKWGGIVYMFFYGLFFNFLLSSLLKMANRRPTLILWLPFLFLYAVGIETDLLTTLNSLLKGIFFTWLIFQVFRIGFRIEL